MAPQSVIERILSDQALTSAMMQATSIQDAIQIASSHGVTVTESDITQLLDSEAFADMPLSDAQLAAIAGGGSYLGSKERNGSEYLKET